MDIPQRRMLPAVLTALALGCHPSDTDVGTDLTFDVGAWVGTRFEGPRLEGVEVWVDQPDGARLTAVTGPEGRATLADFVWAGPITVTYWKPGWVVSSTVDLDRTGFEALAVEGAMRGVLTPVQWSTVSGRALNVQAEGNTVLVSALHGSHDFADSTAYALQALPGHPLVLIGVELTDDGVRWALVEASPPVAEVAQDVDFVAHATSATPYSGSFSVPEGLDSARWGPEIYVTADGMALIGLATSEESTASGFDYAGEHIEIPAGLDPDVRSVFGVSSGRGFSNVQLHGYPVDGPQSLVLPSVPELVSESLTRVDPVEIVEGQAGMFLVAKVLGPDDFPRWVAASQVRGGTVMRLPEIPSEALAQVTGAGDALRLQVYLCEGASTGYAYCDRASGGPVVDWSTE